MKDYRIDPRPRPSSLPHLAVCPRWVSRPDDPNRNDGLDSAARDGTLIHEKMEALADVALEKWEETIWNDPDLGIAWPVPAPVLSEKDKLLPRLKDMVSPFLFTPNAAAGQQA